jgi:hypothetical protein
MTSGAVANLEEKPEEDSSMQQSRACPKAFTVRPNCPARHGDAELPNLADQRRKPRPSLYRAPVATFPQYTPVQDGCEIHWG